MSALVPSAFSNLRVTTALATPLTTRRGSVSDAPLTAGSTVSLLPGSVAASVDDSDDGVIDGESRYGSGIALNFASADNTPMARRGGGGGAGDSANNTPLSRGGKRGGGVPRPVTGVAALSHGDSGRISNASSAHGSGVMGLSPLKLASPHLLPSPIQVAGSPGLHLSALNASMSSLGTPLLNGTQSVGLCMCSYHRLAMLVV